MSYPTEPGNVRDPDATHQAAEPIKTNDASTSGISARRRLRRSKQDRIIGGVCGGLGRYVDVEPVLFRVAFLVLLIPAGLGLLLYLIAWIVMPEFRSEEDEIRDSASRPINSRTAGTVVGGVLILIGALILVERFIDWFDPRIVGGVVLIAIGALIVMRGMQREANE
jgi:phage shock protein C